MRVWTSLGEATYVKSAGGKAQENTS